MSSRRRDALLVAGGTFAVSAAWAWLVRGHAATGDWPGVDEAVVRRFVEASGRSPAQPLIGWVRGDALLFAFLVAGLAAGFVVGWFARTALRAPETEPSS